MSHVTFPPSLQPLVYFYHLQLPTLGFLFGFEARSHIGHDGLELSIELRRILISWFSNFSFQTAGFAGMHYCKRVGTRLFYKWDRAVDDMANVFTSPFKVHLCCGIDQKFIPFYCWIPFVDIHIFTHSSFGVPGFSHCGTLMNNVVVWRGDLWACALLFIEHRPRNRISGSFGNSEFKILTTAKLLSKVAAPFYVISCNAWKSKQCPPKKLSLRRRDLCSKD